MGRESWGGRELSVAAAVIITEPCRALAAVTVSVWPLSLAGPRTSLPRTLIATEPSSAPVAVVGLAVGALLTSVTVTVTVEEDVLGSATPLVVPLSVMV